MNRPNERAESPVSTLYSAYQVGPPVASTTSLRDLSSNDWKCALYPSATLTPGATEMSKLDSSSRRIMFGGLRASWQLACAPRAKRSGAGRALSSQPCYISSAPCVTPERAKLETWFTPWN